MKSQSITTKFIQDAMKRDHKRFVKKLEGTTKKIICGKCNTDGEHKFKRWRRGFIFGGDKIYVCCNCGSEIKQDGTSAWL